MKYNLFVALLLLAAGQCSAAPDTIRAMELTITSNFTTNLIFPYPIDQVDIGSRDILAKKFGSGENVLLLKAGRRDFAPTNISVYTKDGRFYSYKVSYADSVGTYNYSYKTEKEEPPASGGVVEKAKPVPHVQGSSGGVKCKLSHLYVRDGLLWVVIRARNSSAVDFTPEGMSFRIQDRKRVKRVVVQEDVVQPVFSKEPAVLEGGKDVRLAYGLPARTLGKGKQLVVEWRERDGGRRVRMRIGGKSIYMAQGFRKS